jgi:hypothetical protein
MFVNGNAFHLDIIYEMFLDCNQRRNYLYVMIRI